MTSANKEYNDFCDFFREKNISEKYFSLFWKLRRSVECTIVVDNSGSTDEPLDPNQTSSPSIYKEMEKLFNAIFGMMEKLDKNGVNLKFLNKCPKVILVENTAQQKGTDVASNLFKQHDSNGNGKTPLTVTLKSVVNEIINSNDYDGSKKQELVILTDGKDDAGMDVFQSYIQNVHDKYPNFHISIVVVTLNKSIIDSYSDFDNTFRCATDGSKRIDVTFCYVTENERVKQKLSYGDYVAKILLGPIYKEIGDMNDSGSRSIVPTFMFSFFVALLLYFTNSYFSDYAFRKNVNQQFNSYVDYELCNEHKAVLMGFAAIFGTIFMYKFGSLIVKGAFLGVVFYATYYFGMIYLEYFGFNL